MKRITTILSSFLCLFCLLSSCAPPVSGGTVILPDSESTSTSQPFVAVPELLDMEHYLGSWNNDSQNDYANDARCFIYRDNNSFCIDMFVKLAYTNEVCSFSKVKTHMLNDFVVATYDEDGHGHMGSIIIEPGSNEAELIFTITADKNLSGMGDNASMEMVRQVFTYCGEDNIIEQPSESFEANIGKTTMEIIELYGTDYTVEHWPFGAMMYYPNLKLGFFIFSNNQIIYGNEIVVGGRLSGNMMADIIGFTANMTQEQVLALCQANSIQYEENSYDAPEYVGLDIWHGPYLLQYLWTPDSDRPYSLDISNMDLIESKYQTYSTPDDNSHTEIQGGVAEESVEHTGVNISKDGNSIWQGDTVYYRGGSGVFRGTVTSRVTKYSASLDIDWNGWYKDGEWYGTSSDGVVIGRKTNDKPNSRTSVGFLYTNFDEAKYW